MDFATFLAQLDMDPLEATLGALAAIVTLPGLCKWAYDVVASFAEDESDDDEDYDDWTDEEHAQAMLNRPDEVGPGYEAWDDEEDDSEDDE